MILSEEVKIRLNYKNKEHFKNLGYDIDNKFINVRVEHLNKGSHVIVKIKCDECEIEKEIQYFAYIKYLSRSKDSKYRCGKCNQIDRKSTNIERYGEDSPIKIKEFRDNRNKTIIDKYGTDHPCKNKDVKNKIFNTNLERYGVKYVPLNEEIRDKIIKTNYIKYGGVSNLSSRIERDKIEDIMLDRYGFKYSLQIKSIRDVIVERGLITRKNKIKDDYKNIIDIIGTDYTVKCDCGNDHDFVINSYNFYQRIKYGTTICTICNPIDKHISGLEIDFVNFIKDEYRGDILINNRDIIPPQEIDVYFPDLKVGFEFNGLYWHSDEYKEIEYHKNKIEIANKKGIKLLHVYDDDWRYKKDIIKNDIRRIINPNKSDIEEIFEVNNSIAEIYNYNNNLYGYSTSSINICGTKDNNVVSMMNIKKSKNDYEIVRLTGDDNFDQLFKYFLNKYKPKRVVGFVNKDWSIYNFYERNDFMVENETEPDFHYIIDNKRMKNIEGTLFENQIQKIYDSGKIFYKLEIRDK